MRKSVWFIVFVIMMLLTACGKGANEDKQAAPCENTLVPIEVAFHWEPEGGSSEDEYLFTAHVTHDGADVTDADVQFEIWEHRNSGYHFMEETKNEGDGIYTLNWKFPHDGVYYAYYHVTACGMHRMEKKMVVVGDVDVEKITAEPDNVRGIMEDGGHDSEHEEHDDHSGHHE